MSLGIKFVTGNEVNNALYKAICSGDLEKVNLVIDLYGVSHCPSWADGYGLLLTALECKYIDLVKLLLMKGCKLERFSNGTLGTSKSLFHLVIRLGNVELIEMFLDRDSNSINKTEKGDTLLHIAISEGLECVVELLLERGADIELRNSGGMTPLHLAAVRGHIEILEQLLKSGADIESQDNNGKTSLFLAVSSGNCLVVRTLLKHGAKCKCKSKNDLTPLLDATGKGYVEIVQELLDFGADLNDKNKFGLTPLHIACMQKNKSLIVTLLNAGADVNATDRSGMVPCDAIVKRVSSCSIFFENSSVTYLIGKHFSILKIGGFYLNKKNQTFYDMFYNMYCNEITVGNAVISATSKTLSSIIKCCKNEISVMKQMKSNSGFTVYDVFKKLKNPLSVVTESEIIFLHSIDLENDFYLYEAIIRNLLKKAKLRNELLATAHTWFLYIIHLGENEIPTLPEEMSELIISFLSNDELKKLIQCGKEIQRQASKGVAI